MPVAEPSIPRAVARGNSVARLVAWHVDHGRRLRDAAGWAFRLTMALAAWHAATILVLFAVYCWQDTSSSAGETIAAAGFVAVLAAVAVSVQCAVVLLTGVPFGWLLAHATARAGRAGVVLGAAATAFAVYAVERAAAFVWIFLASGEPLAVGAQIAGAIAIGALYGSWLPALRADRA